MKNHFTRPIAALATLAFFAGGVWMLSDSLLSPQGTLPEALAAIDGGVGNFIHHDGGGGGFGGGGGCGGCGGGGEGGGFGGGGGGFGGGGGGGGGGGSTPAPSCTLLATPSSISGGSGTVTLSWGTVNATSLSINNGVGSVTPVSSGSRTVTISASTTFVATVTGPGGTATCSRVVTVTTPPPAPVCTLDLSQTVISWTSNHANTVTIVPLTNSPQVPGGSGGGGGGGSTVISMDFGTLVAQYRTVLQQSVGNFVIDGFYANKATADKICSVIAPGTVNGSYRSDDYSSPGNNTVLLWNGSTWNQYNARNYNSHFRYNFTCVTASGGSGTHPLSGSHTFVPPLGVGTHTYLLTATGPGGTATCQETITIPPPPVAPTCTLTINPDSITSGQSAAISWTSTNATSGFINQGVGTTTPVASGSKAITPTSSTTYTATFTGPGGSVTCSDSIGVLPPPPGAPLCTLSAAPGTIDQGNSSTLSWTTTNASLFIINHGVGTSTPTASGSRSVSPSQTTTYTGVAYGANGQTATCVATVSVNTPPPPPGPVCTLTVSPSKIKTGESVTVSWTSSNVTSGFITGNIGTTSPVSAGSMTVFPPDSFTYVGTFTGPNGTATCSAVVEVEKGGGGCTGNCGGGLNQPTVSLASAPGGQVLAAFVSLSQIPYTGFAAGPLLTAIFWLSVVAWSLGISYLLVGKSAIKTIASRVFNTPALHQELHRAPEGYQVYEDTAHFEAEYAQTVAEEEPVSRAITPSVIAVPAPSVRSAEDGVPPLTAVIESRAHAAGVLLSPEAVELATRLDSDRATTLQKFGALLNEAVRTIPREDGWILLSSERFASLAGTKTSAPGALEAVTPPAAPVVSESATERLVQALLVGNRNDAFALLRSLEAGQVSATHTVTQMIALIDQLYQAKVSGTSPRHLGLADAASAVSPEKLRTFIEVLSDALHASYALPYTGVKIALAHALDA